MTAHRINADLTALLVLADRAAATLTRVDRVLARVRRAWRLAA